MRAKNVTTRPVEVEGGRHLPAGEAGEVNSRHPLVVRHLNAGRLRRSTDPTPTPPPEPDEAPEPADAVHEE